jgi:hypothetical protein
MIIIIVIVAMRWFRREFYNLFLIIKWEVLKVVISAV